MRFPAVASATLILEPQMRLPECKRRSVMFLESGPTDVALLRQAFWNPENGLTRGYRFGVVGTPTFGSRL